MRDNKDNKPSRVASRSEKVGKKRKANNIYNILLAVVIIAIIIVGSSIFLGNDDEQSASPNEKTSHEEKNNDNVEEDKNQKTEDESNEDPDVNVDDESTDEDADTEHSEDENTEEEIKPEEGDEIVESSDPNVEETRVNENWKPIGTEQKGQHVTTYDDTSVDWKEMERALSYGSGIPESDMTVLWLGNGGAPDKAVGTVAPKDHSAKYKVYIEWVDGEGWKPSKVEKLKS
ncbi:YrrS family protein [Bacillus sp. JJ722]|uniref:YrrS family protein n=1 Tax=Bacillus sp. JJ722 TaxID=3122973 RepID=UPI0030006555